MYIFHNYFFKVSTLTLSTFVESDFDGLTVEFEQLATNKTVTNISNTFFINAKICKKVETTKFLFCGAEDNRNLHRNIASVSRQPWNMPPQKAGALKPPNSILLGLELSQITCTFILGRNAIHRVSVPHC